MTRKPIRLLSLFLALAMVLSLVPSFRIQAASGSEIPLPNGDFEYTDTTGWTISGLSGSVATDTWATNNGSYQLDLWASDSETTEVSMAYTAALTSGTYCFRYELSGAVTDSGLSWTVKSGDTVLAQQTGTTSTTGWDSWTTVETDEFTLESSAEVTFVLSGTTPAGYWGKLDNLVLVGTGSLDVEPAPTIYVPLVEGTAGDDFARGADVSSFLSILNSGAQFKDFSGNVLDGQGFFNLLAKSGVNWIRLRVWNNPFDSAGHGYGGGNNDINAAETMGKWATAAGQKVLIDFHYSDFWADPGKQKAPKAWSSMSIDNKVQALYDYTYASLKQLLDAGVDVGMVQVGNETTGSICGESNWTNKAKLFSAGSQAIRAVSAEYGKDIKVAIHWTNPERSGNLTSAAKNLNTYGVDYDVFTTSYYPFWHGTLDNLTSCLSAVATTYGKQVMVAETSWAFTLDDGDGHDNTVRKGNNDSGTYDFTVQGQATEFASVAQAVRNVGDAGVGVFYWEAAWIPVQHYDPTAENAAEVLAQNKALWEQYGSGWASSYASEYDPNDAGVWFGGSACDNQALFDFDGNPLESLKVFKYITTGTEGFEVTVTGVESPELVYSIGDTLVLPETLTVTYSVGAPKVLPVVWNEADVAKVDMNTAGVYKVHGIVDGELDALCTVRVNYPNLIVNPSFESSSMSMYTISASYAKRTTDDPKTGSYSLHFYSSDTVDFTAEQTVALEPGEYTFSLYAQGGSLGDAAKNYAYVKVGDETLTDSFDMTGWCIWANPQVTFTVAEAANVTVGVNVTASQGGAWGTIDDLYLSQTLPAGPSMESLLAQIAELNPLDYTGASWAAMLACIEAEDPELLSYAIENLELKSTAMALGSDISACAASDKSYNNVDGVSKKMYNLITEDYGYNMVRLRTWTGSDTGSCGKTTIINYAKKCADAGLRIMIDFHYADSWADPGKQPAPSAWNVSGTSPEEADRVAALLYDYTYDWITSLVAAGVYPEWVQVGNEIDHGMVWELGRTEYMENFVKLLQAGTNAVRKASPTTKVVIHRSSGAETQNCIDFYQSLIDYGYTDFDVIGLSFYPYDLDPTHMLGCLKETFDELYERFCKDTHREIQLVEIGSNYMENNGGATRNEGYNMIVNAINLLKNIPDGRGTGCMYWEIQNYEYQSRRPNIVWNAFSPGAELICETPITGLALSAENLTMGVGDAEPLRVTYTPAKPDITALVWASSNPEVATVADNGMVLAVSVGETDITVTSTDGSNITATCHVTVTPPIPGLKNLGFELGNQYWVIDENLVGTAKISNSDNHLNGSYSLHYSADANGLDIGFNQSATGLPAGTYTLTCRVMGDNKEATGYLYATTSNGTVQSASFQTKGWTSDASGWILVTLENIVVGADGDIMVGAKVTSSSTSAWGDFDDFGLEYLGAPSCEHVPETVNAKEATCTEDGYTGDVVCTVCGETLETGTVLPALDHDWDEGVVTTPATEASEGELTFTCARCGETKTEVIPALECPSAHFTDTPAKWYHEAIDDMVTRGLMIGTTATTFQPMKAMTRAEAATVLWRMSGSPAPEGECPFTDVPKWAKDACAWAAEAGVTVGTGAGKFSPNNEVTRETMAVLLYRYYGENAAEADLTTFNDSDQIHSWALDAMNWAVANELLKGSNNNLNPRGSMSRAEIAVLLSRYLAD